jgi:hypothetical protein
MEDKDTGTSGFSWSTLGGNLVTGGLSFFGKQKEADAIRRQADALRAKGASEVEVAKLMVEAKRLELEAVKAGAGVETKSGNTALYIGLGVGAVVILGVVIFAVTRKKA